MKKNVLHEDAFIVVAQLLMSFHTIVFSYAVCWNLAPKDASES